MTLRDILRINELDTRISKRLVKWLVHHDPMDFTPEALAAAERILKPSHGDRSGEWHPSSLHTCPRAQVYSYFGVHPMQSFNPQLANLFGDGHFRHLRWQMMLLSAGILTDVEVPVSAENYRLHGSMDGVNTDEGWHFELKGTRFLRKVQSEGPMPEHIIQVHAYLIMVGLDTSVIVYEDKAGQDWAEFEVEYDSRVAAEIFKILESLNAAVDAQKLPEPLDECKAGKGATFNKCSYSHVCNKTNDIGQAIEIGRRFR